MGRLVDSATRETLRAITTCTRRSNANERTCSPIWAKPLRPMKFGKCSFAALTKRWPRVSIVLTDCNHSHMHRFNMPTARSALGQTEEADIAYREAIEVLTAAWQLLDVDSFHQLNSGDGTAQSRAIDFAKHHDPAVAGQSEARQAEAREMLQRSVANYSRLLQKEASPDTLRRLSEAHESLAMTTLEMNPQEAWEQLEQADLGYQLLVDHNHLNETDSLHWAQVRYLRSRCAAKLGNAPQAEQEMASSRQLMATLSRDALPTKLHKKFDALELALNRP
jgi:tetratricopeptide (TPR) repeat protein